MSRAGLVLACGLLGACSFFGSHPLRADAILKPLGGSAVQGQASLSERGDAIQITYDIVGLAPNSLNSLVIHAGGNCGGPKASHAGPSVRKADLGVPGESMMSGRDANRLSRVWADDNGAAVGFFVLRGLSLDGVRSVVGRTLIIHRGADEWNDDENQDNTAHADTTRVSASAVDDTHGEPSRHMALACGVISR